MSGKKPIYYIVSSVCPGAKLNTPLMRSIENFIKRKNAKLILIKSKGYKSSLLLDSKIDKFLIIEKNYKINSTLSITSLALSPHTVDHMVQNSYLLDSFRQAIIGIPRHTCKSFPRSLKQEHGHIPKMIYGTGSLTLPEYPNNISGARAASLHVNGALVVKVLNNKVSIIRQIECDKDGSFYYDLTKYLPNGKTKSLKSVPCISLGDSHFGEHDKKAFEATLEIIKLFRPKNLVYHDVFSGNSISHHIQNKILSKASINLSLNNEFEIGSHLLKTIVDSAPKTTTHYIVKSNHCEHLLKYFEDSRFAVDHSNLKFAVTILYHYFHGRDLIETGYRYFHDLKNVVFLQRNNTIKIEGIDISNHGDEGASGKAGTPKSLGKIFGSKIITGHQHSAEVSIYGNYVNGTSTSLHLPYCKASGGTSWTHTHTLIYPNSLRTHLHIINGLWR